MKKFIPLPDKPIICHYFGQSFEIKKTTNIEEKIEKIRQSQPKESKLEYYFMKLEVTQDKISKMPDKILILIWNKIIEDIEEEIITLNPQFCEYMKLYRYELEKRGIKT